MSLHQTSSGENWIFISQFMEHQQNFYYKKQIA